MKNLSYLFFILLICGGLLNEPSKAELFIPPSSDTVIATWPIQDLIDLKNSTTNSLENAINTSEGLLERAIQPGQSSLYSLAGAALMPWLKSNPDNALFWITLARVQQNKHNFDGAKESLAKALLLEPKNANAHLIMARTQLIQQAYKGAEKSCRALIRNGNFFIASVCNLEVQSHQGKLIESYDGLKKIAATLTANDSNKAWVAAVLADMAARQGLWLESEALLDEHYNENHISTLIEWADVKLRLKKYTEVAEKLSTVVQSIPSSEDALLVRLAIAEKNLNTGENNEWEKRIAERVQLREQRRDLYHASDLALYYLDVEPDSKKALHWAEINWQQAQEYKDKALLTRAKNAFSTTNKSRAISDE